MKLKIKIECNTCGDEMKCIGIFYGEGELTEYYRCDNHPLIIKINYVMEEQE